VIFSSVDVREFIDVRVFVEAVVLKRKATLIVKLALRCRIARVAIENTFYNVDVLSGVKNASAIPLVLGGEITAWGETLDGSDALATIFPRAAAAAEKLWSYDVVTTSDAPYVLDRLLAFRCHMLNRGIGSAPVGAPVGRSPPTGPGSCLV
jgi:hypothetical protein